MALKKILRDIKEKLSSDNDFFYPDTEDSLDVNYIWIGARTGLIGTEFCHYEFIENDGEPDILSLEVHFTETKNTKEYDSIIKSLPSSLEVKPWKYDGGFRRIVCKEKKLNIDNKNIINDAFKNLRSLDDLIGQKLETIIKKYEYLKPANIRKHQLGKSGTIITERVNHDRILTKGIYKSRHGTLQKKLENQLKNNNEYKKVVPESTLGDIRVDVYGLKKSNDFELYDLFEVKPYTSPTDCIREALGQLLLYKCNFERSDLKVDKIFICGSNRLCEYDVEYLNSIKKICKNLKIDYLQIK